MRPFRLAHSTTLPSGMGVASISRSISSPSRRTRRSASPDSLAKVSAKIANGRRALASAKVERASAPTPEMVVVMGVGVPRRLQGAQARDPAKLGKDQRHHMVPAAEPLVVGIAGVTIHKRVEPTPRDRLEKTAKSAIAVAHARSFLS